MPPKSGWYQFEQQGGWYQKDAGIESFGWVGLNWKQVANNKVGGTKCAAPNVPHQMCQIWRVDPDQFLGTVQSIWT